MKRQILIITLLLITGQYLWAQPKPDYYFGLFSDDTSQISHITPVTGNKRNVAYAFQMIDESKITVTTTGQQALSQLYLFSNGSLIKEISIKNTPESSILVAIVQPGQYIANFTVGGGSHIGSTLAWTKELDFNEVTIEPGDTLIWEPSTPPDTIPVIPPTPIIIPENSFEFKHNGGGNRVKRVAPTQ